MVGTSTFFRHDKGGMTEDTGEDMKPFVLPPSTYRRSERGVPVGGVQTKKEAFDQS